MNKIIQRRQVKPEQVQALKDIDPILARVFAARNCQSSHELSYELNKLLAPNLKGLDQACALLAEAIEQQKRILIVGDFDADGATSTVLAIRCLRALGAQHVDYVVPNRFEFGYGLTPEIVHYCLDKQPDLIVTVDNGISSIDGVQEAQNLGIQVVVTDHHLPGKELPKAEAIVNPNQTDCPFKSKAAAGVGVIFYVMLALRTYMRKQGKFEVGQEPNFAEHLDLVALGTVADVVPLDFNNRLLVAQGLKRMQAGLACEGIKALLQVAGRDISQMGAADIGFAVGPRLNAAGRLDDMSLGIQCLLAQSPSDAQMLAKELDALNQERRAIETSMQVEAKASLDALLAELGDELPLGLCLYQADWHQGVIGILASRIKDKLHRPVIVFAQDDVGSLKGSGRSVPGIHLRDVLDEVATANPGLLNKFGGHAMAAGMSLDEQRLPEFEQAFADTVARHAGEGGLQAIIETDGELSAPHLTIEFAQTIAEYGPWGQAFPEPVFDGEFWLVNQKIVGSKHLKLVVAPIDNASYIVDAIAFNVDTKIWPQEGCEKVKLAYKLTVNEFRGRRSVQLMVDYIEPAN